MRNNRTDDRKRGRRFANSSARKALLRGGLGLIFVIAAMSDARAVPAPIRVAYAGSMGAVMDQKIGPAFAKARDAVYQGIGQASYALAHLLESKQIRADVFVPVT